MTMIEQVAKAMVRNFLGRDPSDESEWWIQGVVDARDLARAAIKAMRMPTDAMVRQGEMHCYEHEGQADDWSLKAMREGWEAMIDAALNEQPETK